MSRYHTEHKDKVSKLIPEFEKCAMGGADATSPSTKNKPKPCVLISTRRGLHYFRPNVFGSKFKLKDEYFILDIEEIEYLSEFTRKFYVRGKAPIEFTSPHIDAVVTDLLKSAAEFSIESSVPHEIALTKWQGTKPTTPDVKRHDKLTMYRYKNVCEMYHITRDNTNLRPLEFYENTNRNSIYINGFSSQPEGVEGMALSLAYEGSLHTIHCHAFAPQNVCLMLRKILKISRSVKCIHFMEYEDMSFEFGRFGRIKNLAINSLIITKCFNNPIRLIQFILEFKFARNDFQKLELNNCKMNKRCAVEFGKALATFNCFRTLEILVIRGLETDPKEGNAVYQIIYEATKHLPFLCQFAIEGWQPKIQITPEISNIEAKYLTHLSLSNCILVDMPDPKFAPTIKNFNFTGSVFSLRTFQLLMDALNKHPTYFRLELGELEFPQKDLLAFFDKNRTVFTDRMIEFSWVGNTLSAQTIPGIVNYFIKSPNLKFLDLSRCFSNKSGGVLDQFFMQILGVPLWGIRIFADENTQLGPEIVSKVTKIQSLVSVSLFGHHITDQNIRDLMILPHLGELIVDRTDIDDLDKLFNVYREYIFKKGSIFSFIPPATDSQRLHGKRIQEILDFKNQCIKWLYPGDEFVRSEYYSQYGPDMTHYRKFLEDFPISRRKLPRLEPLCSSDFPRNTQYESSLTQKQVEKAKNGFAAEQISLLPSLMDPPEKLADDVFEHPEWLKQMIKDFNVRKRQYNYATPAPEDPEDKIDEAEIQASLLVVEEEPKVEEHVEEANVEVPQTPDVEVKAEINAEINAEVKTPEVTTPTIEVKKGKGKKNKKSKAKKEENSDSNEEVESSAKFDIPDAVPNTPKVDFDIKKSSSSDSESTPETISHLSPKSPRSLVPDADIPVPQSSLFAQNVTQRSVNINYDLDVSDHDEFNMKTPEDYTLIDLMLACNFSMFEHIANDIDNSRYDYFAKASLDSAIFANKTYNFFAHMVDIELAPITDDSKNLIFRGNAVPARVVGAWPRIVAREWLTQVLRPAFEVIITFLNQGDGFVVQPSKLPEGQNLEHNKKNFRVILTKCVQAILDGESTMPDPLVYAAQIIVQKVSEKFGDFAFNILTSFLFFRFIIPAFSSTQMVGLPPTEPGPLKDALIQTAAIIMTSVLKGRVDEKGPHFEPYNDFAQWTHDRVQEMYREIVAREVTKAPPKVKVDEMKTIVAIHTEAWPIIDKLEHDVDEMTDPEESANGQKFIAMIRRMGPPPYTGEIMPISEVKVQIKPPKMPMPKVPVSPKNLESVEDEFAPEIESPRVDINTPNAPEFDDEFGQDFDSTSSSEEEEKKKKKRGWSAIFKRNKKKQEDKAKIKGAKGDVDVNTNIKGPKVESPKAEISTPGFGANVNTPKAGFGANTPVISPPYVESDFGTNIESPKAEISAREIDVNAPHGQAGFGVNVGKPQIDVNAPKAEISTPSVSAPHGEAGFGLNVGKPSLDVNAPSVSAPHGEAGFDVDVNAPKAEISTPGIGINTPSVSTPHGEAGFGVDINAPKAEVSKPEFGANIKGPNTEVSTPSIGGGLNIGKPQIDVNAPKAEISTPSVSAPHGDGFGVSVEAPKVDANAPKTDVSAPGLGFGAGSPHGKAGFGVNVGKPSLDVNAPNAEVSTPGFGINAPHGDGFGVSVDTPKVDANAPKAEISAPGFGTNIKGPKVDAKKPSIGGGLKIESPNVYTPKAEISTPEFDANAPHGDAGFGVNVGKPQIDVNAPKTEISTPGFGANIEKPNIDINAPKAEISTPGIGINAPSVSAPHGDADFDVDVNAPKVSAPGFGANIKGPKVESPKAEIATPGFGANIGKPSLDVNAPNVSAPHGQAGFGVDINAPKAEVSTPSIGGGPNIGKPQIDVNAPKAEISTPSVDINAPKADVSVPGIGFGTNIKGPKVDAKTPSIGGDVNIGKPHLDVNAPKAEVSTPGIDINAPKAEISTPGFNANSPHGKAGFGVNVGKPSLDVNAPKAEVSTPGLGFGEGIEGPNVDVKTPSIKVESPKINAPKAEISTPSVSAPHGEAGFGVNVGKPSLDVNAPNVDVNAPKVSSPRAQIDVNAPIAKVSTPGIGGMYEGFKFKDKDEDEESSSDGKGGRFGLFKRNQKAKEAKIKGKVDVPKPGIKVESPDVSIGSPSGKGSFGVKTPEVSSPGFNAKVSSPKVDSPQGKTGFGIHADAPNVSVSTPTIGGGIVPDASIHGGKAGQISSPGVDIHGPHIEAPKVEVSSPQGKVSAPGIQGNVSIPHGEISTPDIGAGMSGGIQTPHVESPKAEISSPSINVNGPQGQFSPPNIHGNVSVPQGQISSPGINVSIPQGQVSGPGLDADIRGPHVESPKAEISTPGIGAGIHGGVSVPQGNVSTPGISGPHVEGPNVSGSVSVPQGQISTPQKQISGPGFTSPQGQISSPSINVSSPRVESPKAEISTPGIGAGIHGGVSVPQGNVSTPGISGPHVEGPNVSGSVSVPQGQISTPQKQISGPGFTSPQGQISSPSINVSSPRVESPKAEISTPGIGGGIHAGASSPGINATSPHGQISSPSISVNGPQGQFSSPNIHGNVSVPQGQISSPGINVNGPRVESPKAQISTPGIGGGINVTGPQGQISTPINVSGPQGQVSGPGINVSGPQGQISTPGIDGDVKVPQGRVGFNVPSGRASIKGAINVKSRDVEIPEEDFEEEDYEEEYEEEETATEASEVEVVASAQPQVGTTEISGGLFTRNIPVDNKVTMFSDDEMKSKKPTAELDAINTKVKSGKPMKIQAPKIGGFQGRLVKMAGESRQSSSSSDSDDLPAIFNMHASAAAAVANQQTPSVPQRIQRRPLMRTIGQADRIVPMPGMTNDETITEDHSPNRNNLPARNQQFLLQTQDKKNPQPSGYIQQNNVENSETEDSGPPTAFLIQKGVIPPKAAASVPAPAPAPTTTEDTSPKSRDSRRMRRQNDITEDSIEYNSRKHRPTRGRPDISGVKARSVRDEDESEEENNRRSYRSWRNNDDYDDRDHHRHHYGSRRSHRNNSISDDDDKYRSRGRRPRYHDDDDDDYNRRYRSRRHRHENNDDDDDYHRHRSRSHRGYRHHRDETSSDYDNRKASPSVHSSEEENNKVQQQQQQQQSQPQSPRSARSRRPMHDSGSVSSRHMEKLPAYPEAAPQQSSTSEKQQKKQDKEKTSTTSGEYVTASNIYTADKLYKEVSADNNQQDSWIAAPQLEAQQNTKPAEKTEMSSESVSYDLSTEEEKKSKKPEAEKKVTDEEDKPKKAESSAPEKESSEHSYEGKKVEITLSTTAEGTEDNTKDDTSVASLNSISLRKRDKQPKKSSSAERQKKESSSTKKKAPPRITVGGIDEDDPDKTMISEDFFASPEKKPSVLAPLPLPESPRHIKASEKAKYNAQRPKTPAPDPIEMKPSSVRVRPQYTLAKPRSLNVDVPLMGQPRKRTRVPRK